MPALVSAEEAFDEAIEAAYTMQEAEELWGRESEALAAAAESYRIAVAKYYVITGTHRERFWDQFCRCEPWAIECRIYDV